MIILYILIYILTGQTLTEERGCKSLWPAKLAILLSSVHPVNYLNCRKVDFNSKLTWLFLFQPKICTILFKLLRYQSPSDLMKYMLWYHSSQFRKEVDLTVMLRGSALYNYATLGPPYTSWLMHPCRRALAYQRKALRHLLFIVSSVYSP